MAIPSLMYGNYYKNQDCYGYFKNLLQQLCKKKEEEKKLKQKVVYSEIPEELLLQIIQKLSLPDRLRMGMVCKSWRSAVSVHSQNHSSRVPWLMLPYDKKSNCLRFFDFGENQVYSIKLPKNVQEAWCCGSSKGWLVMVKGPEVSPKIFLFNPISGVEIALPPLETIPCFQSFVFTLEDPFCIADFVSKVELSSVDLSSFVVAATFFRSKILAFCRPEDESWTIFQGIDYEEDELYSVVDILFSNGILHALIAGDQNTGFGAHTVKVRVHDDVIVKLIPQEISDHHPLDDEDDEIHRIPEDEDENEVVSTIRSRASLQHLVESRGELLVVRIIMDFIATLISVDADDYFADDAHYADEDDSDDEFGYFQTLRFQVFKIDQPGDSSFKLNSLDDRVLFVSRKGSISIEGRDLKEFEKKNCIFFLDYINHVVGNFDRPVSRESGIFHFETGRIDRCFPITNNLMHCHMNWFSPNI